LFSNTLAPVVAATSLRVFDMIENGAKRRKQLFANSDRFRDQMQKLGFKLGGKGHPIIPIMLEDAALAQNMAKTMLKKGVYVTGFSFPVVPMGKARNPDTNVSRSQC
jgi:glycine C-acetyltransferase